MVSTYVGVFCCSTFFWHLYTHKLIGLRVSDVVKDIFPYAAVTVLAIGGAWGVSKGMSNVYLSFAIKIFVMTIIYITLLWLSGSIMFKEALVFLKVKTQR